MATKMFTGKKLPIALLFIFLPLVAAILFPSVSFAASDTSIVIQPSKIEVTASPDQKIARSFSIINRSNFNVILKLIVKDYKQVSEDGGLQFYDSKTEPANLWIVPQYLQVGLKPLETKEISFVVNVPKDFSGGGHYGAILFQPVGDTSNISTSNFGELVLLTVAGSGLKTSAIAKVVNFSTGIFQQGNTVDFSFKMQNTGNTHFDTQGKLVVKNWLGSDIGNFNIGQLTVYPNTSRVFTWRWNGTPSLGLFRVEVLLSSSASGQNLKSVGSAWFIILPWQVLLIILLVGVAIFALIRYREKVLKLLGVVYNTYGRETKIKVRHLSKSISDLTPNSIKDIFSK